MRISVCCLVALLAGLVFAQDTPKLVEEPDAFKTLVNPDCSHCKDEAKRRKGDLKDSDRVLCWIRGKYDGGAIPFRFYLNPYRVISDTYGVFVYDADAGFARGFAPSLDFTFHGWRNGVMVIKHKDGSLYSALTGIAFAGPNKGKQLEAVPTIQSNWGWWLEQYPDTVAYHMYEKYKPVEAPAKPHASSLKSRSKADPRLKEDERVLGVADGRQSVAYPLGELKKQKLIADTLNNRTIYALYHETTGAAAAYRNRAIWRQKNIELDWSGPVELVYDDRTPNTPFKDKRTGSLFDIAGRCVSGKMKDYTLVWVDSVEVKWFAWAAEYPKTTIYGKD